MNSSLFPVSDDFGHVMNTIFELVDIKFLILYMLSFLTLIGFGLLFLFVVMTLILIEFFQDRYPAIIRFEFLVCLLNLNILISGSEFNLNFVGREKNFQII